MIFKESLDLGHQRLILVSSFLCKVSMNLKFVESDFNQLPLKIFEEDDLMLLDSFKQVFANAKLYKPIVSNLSLKLLILK